jgi:hypothetical protein
MSPKALAKPEAHGAKRGPLLLVFVFGLSSEINTGSDDNNIFGAYNCFCADLPYFQNNFKVIGTIPPETAKPFPL